ncbi:ATP-binding protein [Sphaerisporangium sp. NPDC005288]|uniref:sensor histidine kinase n=1 Tax=Sphaerisporangium sp. NPDC005288 TaxID=3155114 RepID=UPI0033B0D397
MRWSVRLRATVAATLIVAAALAAAAVALTTILRADLERSANAEAAQRAGVAASRLAVAPMPAVPESDAKRAASPGPAETAGTSGPAKTAGTSGAAKTAGSPSPAKTAGSSGPVKAPGVPGSAKGAALTITKEGASGAPSEASLRTVPDPDVHIGLPAEAPGPGWGAGAYTTASTVVETGAGPVTVMARSSLGPAREALAVLNRLLVFGIPVLLLLVAAMTWFFVGRALVPVSAIRARLADITARDLHRRVPVPAARDEVAALARTVNATLDRLERAVEQHRRFVADAAHELRSPIATLRTRLELAPAGETAVEALCDVRRLQSLAADLLLLAALDAGAPPRADEVDLGQVAAEESLRPRPRAGIRVELDVQPDVVVRGSRPHLARMIVNLVDNAVRHATSSVQVRVAAEGADGDGAVLEVRDDGPGIPVEDRDAVFDRFTRLDEARTRDAGGSGLGLAIVREIVVLHGGAVAVTESGGGGACFTARLPVHRRTPTND